MIRSAVRVRDPATNPHVKTKSMAFRALIYLDPSKNLDRPSKRDSATNPHGYEPHFGLS